MADSPANEQPDGILNGCVCTDGGLYSLLDDAETGEYIGWSPEFEHVTLDGMFTAADLEMISRHMRRYTKLDAVKPAPQALSAALVARAFSVMLPKHDNRLTLDHNPHRAVGMAMYLQTTGRWYEFTGPLERQKCAETGELWVLKCSDGDAHLRLAAASLDAIAQWLEDTGLAFGS